MARLIYLIKLDCCDWLSTLYVLLQYSIFASPVSVTDTEYRGISKYRYWYQSRYSKYRKIPNTEEKIQKKSVNRYFNFVNTTSRDQSLRPFWRQTQPDWIISTIRLFSNFTQNRNDYSIFPVVTSIISLHSIHSSSYLGHRDLGQFFVVTYISSFCQRARFSCVNFLVFYYDGSNQTIVYE